jgi:hypothetical protein
MSSVERFGITVKDGLADCRSKEMTKKIRVGDIPQIKG